ERRRLPFVPAASYLGPSPGDHNEVRALLAHLGQARHDPAPALRGTVARTEVVRRARLRLLVLRRASLPAGRKLDLLAESLCGWRRRAHQAHAHRPDGLHRTALPSA